MQQFTLFGVTLNYHWYTLPLLFLLCLVGGILAVQYMRRRGAVLQLAQSEEFRKFLRGYSPWRAIIKLLLFWLGVASLLIITMHPRFGKKEEAVEQYGRDMFVCLDVSRSMLAEDVAPNRMEMAKKKIRSLLKNLSCDRAGLILFSGTAFVQCPLTNDYGSFLLFLDRVDAETISSGTTATDRAIDVALRAFDRTSDSASKLLILFTDGEDFSDSLAQKMKEAQEKDMHIFSLGVGSSEGAPIPVFDKNGLVIDHLKNEQGDIVITRMNENLLRSLAQESGGIYVPITKDKQDIKKIVHHVEQFEKSRLKDKNINSLRERSYLFAIVSFFCFLFEWML